MPITINSDIESNYEISVCNRCQKEYYTIYYAENGCTCLSEKERAKIEKQKQNWRNMQLRSAEKSRLKRLELKGNKTSVEKKETLKTQKNQPISLSKHRVKVKPVSEKQRVINAEISAAKLQVVASAVDNNCYYCHSCGKTSVFLLDCSHRISIKHRPDLACDINNIKLECRFCHLNFEAERMETMTESNCFLEDMKYIYDNDSEKFQKLFYKLLDYYEANPTTKVKSIIKKIENFE